MKRLFFIIVIAAAFLSNTALGRVERTYKAKKHSTKLEAFMSKRGRLLIKEFYKLGKMQCQYGAKIGFEALVIYEPGHKEQGVRGIKVEIEEVGRLGNSNSSFLDLEEIRSLSKALRYMLKLATKWKNINRKYTEVTFSTRGDFQIGFYQLGTTQTAFASSGYVGKASCFFYNIKDLSSVKTLIDKGMRILNY